MPFQSAEFTFPDCLEPNTMPLKQMGVLILPLVSVQSML